METTQRRKRPAHEGTENDYAGKRMKKKEGGKGKRATRRERQEAKDAEEERRLTSLLFGGGGGKTISDPERGDFAPNVDDNETKDDAGASLPLFEIDRTGATEFDARRDEGKPSAEDRQLVDWAGDYGDDDDDDEESDESDGGNDGPAWVDEDDANIEVSLLNTSRLRKLRTSRNEAAASALSGVELERRLRQRYESTAQVSARTDWANLDDGQRDEDDSDEDDEGDGGDRTDALVSSSEPLLQDSSSSSTRLPRNMLKIVRCTDANQTDPNNAVVQAAHFHPGSDPDKPLLLTAGLDKTLRFFHVGEEKSEKVHAIHFAKLPIYSASFLGSTGNVVVSGRRPFYYIYDAAAGKLEYVPRILGREYGNLERCVASPDGRTLAFLARDGFVTLVDAHSKQRVSDLKMNGTARAVCFDRADGRYLVGSGGDGDVYRWDLRHAGRRCVERFSNQDGTVTSSIAMSERHMAVGAESGVVNLYSEQRGSVELSSGRRRRKKKNSSAMGPSFMQSQQRQPIKSIMNMRTVANRLCFNGDGQILAMSSRFEKDCMKLLHVPSATVFSNWPTSKTPLGYVWSMDFSPKSKYLAIGNDKGNCLLYQLMHYQD